MKILEIQNLSKEFYLGRKQSINAVDNVTLSFEKNKTFGLVGESGCGKTTLGRLLASIYQKSAGEILYRGNPLNSYSQKKISKNIQMIFQDPDASLNPRMSVNNIISEGLDIHGLWRDKNERKKKIGDLLELVGLQSEHGQRYPHEFSGGQKQRIGIARALALDPEFLICDEPVSALDVSVQAQIVNLLQRLKKERNLGFLFIAHDLSVVKYFSDRIGVMYKGKLVEISSSNELYKSPLHPYTKVLLEAVPKIKKSGNDRSSNNKVSNKSLKFDHEEKRGCVFKARCRDCRTECNQKKPELKEISKEHFVACHKY